MSENEVAQSVDDVRRMLQRCVDVAREENSAAGYFPLLYLWETEDIAAAADAGTFSSPDQLRSMIVAFSNRFFAAREQFRRNAPAAKAWSLAFNAARSSNLVVLHLLLAINAHINVDLGVAAAETGVLGDDFSRVDGILAQGVVRVQAKLNRTTPVLRVLDTLGGGFDEMLTIYSLKAARHQALELARRLSSTSGRARTSLIAEADDLAFRLGQRLLDPPLRDRLVLASIWLSERNVSPREFIDLLAQAP